MPRLSKDLYIATTESGATYAVNDRGGVHYTSADGWSNEYYRNWVAFDRRDLDHPVDNIHKAALDLSVDADVPVVGLSIYGFNFSEWRISTPVVTVETLESED